MKKALISNLLVAVSGMIYCYLFWQEGIGLNSFLFSIFLLVVLSIINPNIWQTRRVIFMGFTTVFSAILVVWHHSFLAKFTHIISLLAFIGFVQARELRFAWYAFLLGLSSLFTSPFASMDRLRAKKINQPTVQVLVYWSKLILLPLLIGTIFFFFYYQANLHFAEIMDRFGKILARLFSWDWSFGKIMLFILGSTILMSLLWPSLATQYFQSKDKKRCLNLIRSRPKKVNKVRALNALRKEFWSAKLTIGLLNGLLFIVNITDLRYVWVEYEVVSAAELKQYVHSGTYLLIFAILMAMLVILFFFRKNLNFFPDNRGLIDLANLWILQNALLALSVGHRNYQYISQYGLAYKRLAVIFFLILVLFGLFTLFLKIKQKRTLYYLFLINGWALYTTFLLTSAINWDLVITRFNMKAIREVPIDLYFLGVGMSDKNLFILEAHKEMLVEQSQWTRENVDDMLKRKRQKFANRVQKQSWKSWNFSDSRNKRLWDQ